MTMRPSCTPRPPIELGLLLAITAVLWAVRLFAATRVGFGDSEALYASYALHPQPAYLDHPGLIGLIARAIGGGTAPTPERAHFVTSAVAALVPWAMSLACRAAGASWPRALAAGAVVAFVPEVAVGTFALTPDLPLTLAWAGAIALAALGLRAAPGSTRAFVALAFAGTLAGVATASKAAGGLLLVALATTYASGAARAHARTVAPWAGLVAGLVVAEPIAAFEAHLGWPMLHHRLVDTQSGSGLSLRNLGALLGGQLIYLSPLVAVLAVQATGTLWRERRKDAVGALLFWTAALPAAALAPLCLWSRVAEPHWVAPALLALVPAATRSFTLPPRRLVVASTAVAAAMVAAAHAWVLTPIAMALTPATLEPRLDLSNELYGWKDAVRAARQEVASMQTPEAPEGDVVLVGPHWVVCAQLEAAVRGAIPVGCDTPIPDDFDAWWPRVRWRAADAIIWVTDARFGPPPRLPSHALLRTREVRVERGGRTVRVFTIATLTRRAQA